MARGGKRKEMPKPRNPVVMLARQRRAGPMHDKRNRERSMRYDDQDFDVNEDMDSMISRAENLLNFMSEEETAEHLMNTGASAEDAFLAIKAVQVK